MDLTFRKYRRQFRSWKNSARLRRELARYERIFDARGLAIPSEMEIKSLMARRFPHIRPGKKGSLNILAIYHHYNWENGSLLPALQKFGTVRHYDWFDEFNHQREAEWHRKVKAAMNKALVPQVEQWLRSDKTDVVFTYLSGALVLPETMAGIRSLGVPLINLSLNDKEYFVGKIRNGQAMGMRDIARYFDICWTSTGDALKKYCAAGATPLYLPEGANPELHKPYGLEKLSDVSFVGQCYGNRPEIIKRLKARGIAIEEFGQGWPSGPIPTEDMIRLYSRSKINLGFGGVSGHRETYCLKGRDFEVPMSGGLYLTEYHPELEKVYDLDREILTYRNFDELVTKIHFLLSNPEEAEAIRRRGFQKARREHTWEARFTRIFELMGLI